MTPSIAELIHEANRWVETQPDVFTVYVTNYNDSSVPESQYVVNVADLRVYHKHLPEILRSLSCHNFDGIVLGYAQGLRVSQTLKLLNNEHVEVTDSRGSIQRMLGIYKIEPFGDKNEKVILCGIGLNVKTVYVNNQKIDYVVGSTSLGAIINKSYLETRFPGWENRLAVGIELGVDSIAALTKLVFSAPTQLHNNIELNSVEFN